MERKIDPTASIENSRVAPTASVGRNASLRGCTIGDRCVIGDLVSLEDTALGTLVQIYPYGNILSSRIGDYSYAQKNCSIWHAETGKFCSMSWNVTLGGASHDFHKLAQHAMLYSPLYGFAPEPLYDRFAGECRLGNDVWVAAGVNILRNVTVGDGAVIGAGAVVTRDVEPYAIMAGVPARRIGSRCDEKYIDELLALRWWDLPEQVIGENIALFNRNIDDETLDRLRALRQAHPLPEPGEI